MRENEFMKPIREFLLGASMILVFMSILIFVPYLTSRLGLYLIPSLFFKGEEVWILWAFGLLADVIIAGLINLSCSLGHDMYETTIEVKEAHEKADIEKERIIDEHIKELERNKRKYVKDEYTDDELESMKFNKFI
jgi:hypothetical protein